MVAIGVIFNKLLPAHDYHKSIQMLSTYIFKMSGQFRALIFRQPQSALNYNTTMKRLSLP